MFTPQPGVQVTGTGKYDGFYGRRPVAKGPPRACFTEERWNRYAVQGGSKWCYEKDDDAFIYYSSTGRAWLFSKQVLLVTGPRTLPVPAHPRKDGLQTT